MDPCIKVGDVQINAKGEVTQEALKAAMKPAGNAEPTLFLHLFTCIAAGETDISSSTKKQEVFDVIRRAITNQCKICTGFHGRERDCPLKKTLDTKMRSQGLTSEWGRVKNQLYYKNLSKEE